MLLSEKNIKRFESITNFIHKPKRLLDIGCKDGQLRNFLNDDIEYHGLDINLEEIKKLNKSGILCMCSNAEKIPMPDSYYNTVVMGEVLEHLPNMGLVLQEVYRVLNNKGELIISVPNGEFKTRLYFMLKRFYKISYVKKCEKRPAKVGGHVHMFNIRQLQVLMKSYNFVINEYINGTKDEYIIIRCSKIVY